MSNVGLSLIFGEFDPWLRNLSKPWFLRVFFGDLEGGGSVNPPSYFIYSWCQDSYIHVKILLHVVDFFLQLKYTQILMFINLIWIGTKPSYYCMITIWPHVTRLNEPNAYILSVFSFHSSVVVFLSKFHAVD